MSEITDEQIDAAWEIANESAKKDYANEGALVALEKLGIEQCECAYNHIPGMVLGMEVGEDGKCQPEPCPDCNGKGWVKGEDDE